MRIAQVNSSGEINDEDARIVAMDARGEIAKRSMEAVGGDGSSVVTPPSVGKRK